MTDIKSKRPKVLRGQVASLRLTPEEQLLVARMDGELSVSDLVGVTGLDEARVEQLVSKLASEGALDLAEGRAQFGTPVHGGEAGTTSMADLATALGMDPSVFIAREAAPIPVPSQPRALLSRDLPADVPTLQPDVTGFNASSEGSQSTASTDEHAAEDDEASLVVAERNYRQIYAQRWHALPVDQRVLGARAATAGDLFALTFDPDPRVIMVVLENPMCGLDHVRLIAFHHRTGTGLEILARRQDWLRDLLVERRLLRNPMVGDIVLGRIMGPKRLSPTYKIAIDREIPELTRIKCRAFLRQKWQSATSEERADLLLRTEGRCLILMTGCTIDAKTTAMLCGRPINSVMFVQSIAKFSASPPGLLAHLMKQPFVRKNMPLKKMLLAHPNMPGDVKRSV